MSNKTKNLKSGLLTACALFGGVGITSTILTSCNSSVTTTETFIVQFNTNGGSFIESQKVKKDGKATKPATDPIKSGCTFLCWYADEKLESEFNFDNAITKDTIVYAKYDGEEPTGEKVIVYFETEGGTHIEPQKIDKGSKATKPDNPTKEGYTTFDGWFTDTKYTKAFNFDTTINEDTILYAKFSGETPITEEVFVYFETDGGTHIEPLKIKKGETVTRPADPKKEGYKFVDWYADDKYTKGFDFNAAINEDTIIYAKYDEDDKKCTVVFMFSNGTYVERRITPNKTFKDAGVTAPDISHKSFYWAYFGEGEGAPFTEDDKISGTTLINENPGVTINLDSDYKQLEIDQSATFTATVSSVHSASFDIDDFAWTIDSGSEDYIEITNEEETETTKAITVKAKAAREDDYSHVSFGPTDEGYIVDSESVTIDTVEEVEKSVTVEADGELQTKVSEDFGFEFDTASTEINDESKTVNFTYYASTATEDQTINLDLYYDDEVVQNIGNNTFDHTKTEDDEGVITFEVSDEVYEAIPNGETAYVKEHEEGPEPVEEKTINLNEDINIGDVEIINVTSSISEESPTITIDYNNGEGEAQNNVLLALYNSDDEHVTNIGKVNFEATSSTYLTIDFENWDDVEDGETYSIKVKEEEPVEEKYVNLEGTSYLPNIEVSFSETELSESDNSTTVNYTNNGETVDLDLVLYDEDDNYVYSFGNKHFGKGKGTMILTISDWSNITGQGEAISLCENGEEPQEIDVASVFYDELLNYLDENGIIISDGAAKQLTTDDMTINIRYNSINDNDVTVLLGFYEEDTLLQSFGEITFVAGATEAELDIGTISISTWNSLNDGYEYNIKKMSSFDISTSKWSSEFLTLQSNDTVVSPYTDYNLSFKNKSAGKLTPRIVICDEDNNTLVEMSCTVAMAETYNLTIPEEQIKEVIEGLEEGTQLYIAYYAA